MSHHTCIIATILCMKRRRWALCSFRHCNASGKQISRQQFNFVNFFEFFLMFPIQMLCLVAEPEKNDHTQVFVSKGFGVRHKLHCWVAEGTERLISTPFQFSENIHNGRKRFRSSSTSNWLGLPLTAALWLLQTRLCGSRFLWRQLNSEKREGLLDIEKLSWRKPRGKFSPPRATSRFALFLSKYIREKWHQSESVTRKVYSHRLYKFKPNLLDSLGWSVLMTTSQRHQRVYGITSRKNN